MRCGLADTVCKLQCLSGNEQVCVYCGGQT